MAERVAHYDERSEEEVIRAVFKVEADHDSGTGFLIDQRYILTARHVVGTQQGKEVKITDVLTGEERIAKIWKILREWDTALLRLNEPISNVQPLELSEKQLQPDTRIRIYGFPHDIRDRWHTAKIAGRLLDENYQITFDSHYQNQLNGLSGSPVFLENTYSVIGVLYYHDPDTLTSGRIVPSEAFPQIKDSLALIDDPWCYVVLSEAERSQYTLQEAVDDAINLLQNDPLVQQDIADPECRYAADLVSSLEEYKSAVGKLCRAKIAIFDITRYEPAMMLLLGIRSVVKRGITIVSMGGEYAIGDVIDLPFNIKETNIISHSTKQQNEAIKEKKPPYLIRTKILNGLLQLQNLPQYLDLPSFDAVRNLPSGYREPDADNVLVLCSYSKKYQKINWKRLQDKLQVQLDRKIDATTRSKNPKVARILDLMSPRLVSHSIYETIRRVVLCIADWTEWRPNVFYEFGVRLAITNTEGNTVCIIEDKHKKMLIELYKKLKNLEKTTNQINDLIYIVAGVDDSKNELFAAVVDRFTYIIPQCVKLLELFNPLEYSCSHPDEQFDGLSLREHLQREQSRYEDIMYYYRYRAGGEVSSRRNRGRIPDFTYGIIEQKIDESGESISVPVYLELLRTAQLFEVGETEGRAAVLYPGNETLKNNVEIGIRDRFLAAWYFIRMEYKNEEIIKDANLFRDFILIGTKLSRILRGSRPDLAKEIHQTVQTLRKMQKEMVL